MRSTPPHFCRKGAFQDLHLSTCSGSPAVRAELISVRLRSVHWIAARPMHVIRLYQGHEDGLLHSKLLAFLCSCSSCKNANDLIEDDISPAYCFLHQLLALLARQLLQKANILRHILWFAWQMVRSSSQIEMLTSKISRSPGSRRARRAYRMHKHRQRMKAMTEPKTMT